MTNTTETTDIVIVGAGITGIYMAHKAREIGLNIVAFERGSGVGGTWYWNRYPGLRCDVESVNYSYSFSEEIQQEWTWKEKFPSQPEILKYLEFVADKLDVTPLFRFDTEVTDAVWNEQRQKWTVTTNRGDVVETTYIVWGTGILSTPKIPEIPGMAEFGGELLNTATWPHTPVDFTGKKVAVLGTGSSGIQVIPIAAEQAEHVYVLQRTPSYTLPAHNKPLDADYVAHIKANYSAFRAEARASMLGAVTDSIGKNTFDLTPEEQEVELQRVYDYGSPMRFASTFDDIVVDLEANKVVADFVERKIRERVANQAIADKLIPTTYPIVSRRLCIDTNYYETFNRENVTLIDLFEEELVRLTPTGFETTSGAYDVDIFILATGFDAMTGTLRRINIVGRDGITLKDKWGKAPSTYMGLSVSGFPNSFMVTGPGSPSASSNVVLSIEQHVEWITNMLQFLQKENISSFDPTPEAEQSWVNHVAEVAAPTIFPLADTWYTGTNIPGKPRVVIQYLGGVGPYEAALLEVANDTYRGFSFTH
ncbi:flavin-containing monooxygenase [Aurantimicrobium minutum]|uniref:flavin-containing monooxygenase n=1 Tax=Aurantimicrobium minutum TaxID=708131 RepID=UPI002476CA87|nr:NAD(P)/FAD-dependent oxidoreductase [Aurantimicrobium minutum]MDH6536114.1 cation diffusion facilitator CzcD-associated flavoprotein CzcO [Aurantimicrobium minutum]